MAEALVRRCAACEVNADKCYFALGKQDPRKGWVIGKDGWQYPGEYLCGAPSCQKMGGHGTSSRAKVKAEPTVKPTIAKVPASSCKGKAALPGSVAATTVAATEAAVLAVKTGVDAAAAEAAAAAAEAAAAVAEGTTGLVTTASTLRQKATKLASQEASHQAAAATRLEAAKVAARAAAKRDASKPAARAIPMASSSTASSSTASSSTVSSTVGGGACALPPAVAHERPPTDYEVRASVQKAMERQAVAQAPHVTKRAAMAAAGCFHSETLKCSRCCPDPAVFCVTCGHVLHMCEGHLGESRVLRKR